MTFVATVNVVLHNRLTPVLVDVEPRTYNMDPALIEAKLTRRTRCVMPVHLAGLPCDMAPILELARRRRLRVLEDSCETVLARYRGRSVGSFGEAAGFSTHAAHCLVTGVGGLAVTSDRALAVSIRSLVNHGRDPAYLDIDAGEKVSPRRRREIVARRFRFASVGHSFRATELEAAIGVAQLEAKDDIIRRRRANARFLSQALADVPQLQLPFVPPDREHSFMVFPLALRRGDKRPLVDFLERRGIETRDLLPLIHQPAYRGLFGGGLEKRYPVARWLDRGAFYVGCHQGLGREDLAYMADSIRAFFRRREPRD